MASRIPIVIILLGALLLAAALPWLVTDCALPTSLPKGSTETPPAPSPSTNTEAASSTKEMLLTVSQPQDNTVTNTDRIEVKGHTKPGAVVSVQDKIATADSNGNFSVTITLEEGANIMEVVASDEAGNEARITLVVTWAKGG